MAGKDLWPQFEIEEMKTPKAVLTEQARFLSEKTNGVLRGEIEFREIKANNLFPSSILWAPSGAVVFRYSFCIFAPNIGYRYNLFSIMHDPVKFYPLEVEIQSEINSMKASSEEELEDIMSHLFNKEETQGVVRSLFLQAK